MQINKQIISDKLDKSYIMNPDKNKIVVPSSKAPFVFMLIGAVLLGIISINHEDRVPMQLEPVPETIVEGQINTEAQIETVKSSQPKEQPKKVEAKEPVVKKREPAPVTQEKAKPAPKSNFRTLAKKNGLHPDLINAIAQVAKEEGTKPEYLATLVLSENTTSPHQAIGDGGYSYGPYQIYTKVHKSTPLNPSIIDCAKDYLCSTRWTAKRFPNYFHGHGSKGWIGALSRHNCPSDCAPSWYRAKIEKNGLKMGLAY